MDSPCLITVGEKLGKIKDLSAAPAGGGPDTRRLGRRIHVECMDHAEHVATQWRALVDTLEALREDRVGVTEACRKVVAIRGPVKEETNELFLPFIGVDSEDEHPLCCVLPSL